MKRTVTLQMEFEDDSAAGTAVNLTLTADPAWTGEPCVSGGIVEKIVKAIRPTLDDLPGEEG